MWLAMAPRMAKGADSNRYNPSAGLILSPLSILAAIACNAGGKPGNACNPDFKVSIANFLQKYASKSDSHKKTINDGK
jgi:hypothetical protein